MAMVFFLEVNDTFTSKLNGMSDVIQDDKNYEPLPKLLREM